MICSAGVAAQPSRQAFESARQDALSMMLPAGTHASYIEIAYPSMTMEEAQALLERIGDDYSDPRWGEASQVVMLDGEPLRSVLNIWFLDGSHYRVNEDIPQWEGSPTVDAVVNGTEGWIRGANGALTALDLRNVPPMRDPRSVRSQVDRFVQYFLCAGVGMFPRNTLDSFSSDEDSWSAVLRNERDGSAAKVSGRFVPDTGQFLLAEAVYFPSGTSAPSGGRTEVTGYEFDEYLQTEIPTQVLLYDSGGKKQRQFVRNFAKPFDRETFKDLARLPSGEHTDPLRPDTQLRRIDDFRTSVATRTEIDPVSGDETIEPLADNRKFAKKLSWDLVGWGVLLCLVIAFLLVRFKSKS